MTAGELLALELQETDPVKKAELANQLKQATNDFFADKGVKVTIIDRQGESN